VASRYPTGTFLRWRLSTPEGEESCRWVSIDRRWVSLTLGKGTEAGKVVVADNTGKREVADSYDGALELARTWRT